MRVRLHTDVDEFRAVALEFYRRDPVLFTVELTLLRTLSGEPLLLTVWESGKVVGAAIQTPPMPLLCSGIPLHAVAAVVDALAARPLTAVRGRRDVAQAFASRWASHTGATAELTTEERIYRLAALVPPDGVSGAARVATESDVDVVAAWVNEFHVTEFGEESDLDAATANVRTTLANGNQYVLWERDGTAVSVAGVRAPVAQMSRIGPVFTPVELRGNGYGSAVTAAAAQWALHAGVTEVVLFTNLANPVSNRIYQRIGFTPVADSARIDLRAKRSESDPTR